VSANERQTSAKKEKSARTAAGPRRHKKVLNEHKILQKALTNTLNEHII
jgi:hypothetical protein